jgi:hypothetical protein
MLHLPEAATAIIERHHQQDAERIARARARTDQRQEVQRKRDFARAERDELAAELRRNSKDETPAVKRAREAVARLDRQIEGLSVVEGPVMTAQRLREGIPPARYEVAAIKPKLLNGESNTVALKRVRAEITSARAERKAVKKAPQSLSEVKERLTASLTALENKGRVNTLAMFFGGEPDFPSVTLPDRSRNVNTVPDGIAFAVFMFGADAVMERMTPFLEFNADPANALSDAEREKRLSAIDAKLERLGREEAALVEAIVAEGGTAYHTPTANALHVLGIALAA